MNQPNDLAIAPNGTLYPTDPNRKNGTGLAGKPLRQAGKD